MVNKYKIFSIILVVCYFIRYLIMKKLEYLHDGGMIFIELILFLIAVILTIIYYKKPFLEKLFIGIVLSFISALLSFKITFWGSMYEISNTLLMQLNFILFYLFVSISWKLVDRKNNI